MKEVTLCHKPGRCCPVLIFKEDVVKILDDYGNQVVITKKQWEVLVKKVKKDEI